MVFKTLVKKGKILLEPRTVQIYAQGKVYFSRDISKKLKGFKAVVVMVDLDYNKLAFVPTNDDENGYILTSKRKGLFRQVQISLLAKVGIRGKFKARFTENKIIVDKINVNKFKDFRFKEDEEELE